MNTKYRVLLTCAAIAALLFPPYIHYGFIGGDLGPNLELKPMRRVERTAGWQFIGVFTHNQEIRWGVLLLELGAIAIGFGATSRRGIPSVQHEATAVRAERRDKPQSKQTVNAAEPPLIREPASSNPWANTTKGERMWAVVLCWIIPLGNGVGRLDDGLARIFHAGEEDRARFLLKLLV